LETFDPLWFEEPIPPDNLLEFQNVAKQVRIPIATGERMTTKAEFSAVLRTGGASILQPALGRSGGILETKKIAAIGEVYNAQIAPHLYAGPVEWAANIQLAANIPNLLLVETILTGGDFHLKLIKNSIKWEDGFIIAPTEPGLGISFDEQVALDNPYNGKELHLQMSEEGCDYQNKNDFLGGAPPRKH
jgi:L-alanine-DL-glutamate epimerase-like enolase superfamily enzyme